MIHNCLILLIGLSLIGAATAQSGDLYDETTFRTIELNFNQSDYWTQLIANKQAEIDISADLTMDGITHSNVGVRFKGNSSYNGVQWSQKKSFKITMDSFVSGQDLMGYDKLNLNNSYHDPTFIREVLSYNILRRYMPASKANFVKLIINGANWGVYVNVQQVDKKMLGEWFNDNDGNQYKSDKVSTTLTWQGASHAPYQSSYELKSDPNPTTWVDLVNVCDQLNNSTTPTVLNATDAVFSVDRSLWMLAVNSVLSTLDSYVGAGHNYYVYQDDYHGRMQTIPWDQNGSFGVFINGFTAQTIKTLDPLHNITNTSRPLVSKLIARIDIRDHYAAHIRTILDEVFDWNVLGPMVAQYTALIDAEVQADPKKLYTYTDFVQNINVDVTLDNGTRVIPGLQDLVNTKRSYLLNHSLINRAAPTLSNVTQTPAQPTDTDTVTVTAHAVGPANGLENVSLHHRTIGAFTRTTMFDDGLHGDGSAADGVYGATIPVQAGGRQVDYFVSARSSSPNVAKIFEPRNAEGSPYSYIVTAVPVSGSVAINEFVAKNDTGITDEAGEFEDWIEILNTSGAPLVVDGLYVTDDLTDPTKWQIPSGNTLQPDEVLLIWADDDPADGPLHANFKLGGSGEEIAIFDTDGLTLLDYFVFGSQEDDISTGRLYDGVPPFVTFILPSPNSRNQLPGCGIRAYSAQNSMLHNINFEAPSGVMVGQPVTLEAREAPATSNAILALASSGDLFPIPLTTVSLLLSADVVPLATILCDATGAADFSFIVPNIPALSGVSVNLQVFAADPSATLHASNALEVTICP